MKYNLQFFADEGTAGAENSGTAEPATQSETVNEGGTVTEPVDDTQGAQAPSTEGQDADTNAMFANVRRKAEEKAQAKYQRQMADLDALFAGAFGDYVNPETNQKIRGAKDYFEAVQAQKRAEQKAELASKGVDLNMLNDLIANSPEMLQYKQMLSEFQREKTIQAIDADVAELSKLDPNIKDINSVPNEVLAFAKENNMTLSNAYKCLNFGNVSAQKTAAIQQRTINQIAGKAHLTPVNGVAQNVVGVDIPEKNLASWRDMYPGLSDAELRKKYNAAVNGKR